MPVCYILLMHLIFYRILCSFEMKWKLLSRVGLFVTPWIVHGILQARTLEWEALPSSSGSSQTTDWTQVDSFPDEPPGKPVCVCVCVCVCILLYIKKQRHYFANKGLSSQGYGFPVVMYGCESWTIKKAEHRKIDALELWCWRRLLGVPWTARRANQSI